MFVTDKQKEALQAVERGNVFIDADGNLHGIGVLMLAEHRDLLGICHYDLCIENDVDLVLLASKGQVRVDYGEWGLSRTVIYYTRI